MKTETTLSFLLAIVVPSIAAKSLAVPLPVHPGAYLDPGCPETKPMSGDGCPPESENLFCEYQHTINNVIRTDACYCVDEGTTFVCETISAHPIDDVLEPPTTAESLPIDAEEEIIESCPEEMPLAGLDKCSTQMGGCQYHPFKCPGSDKETFTTHCYCDFDGIIQCMQATVNCNEDPIDPPTAVEQPLPVDLEEENAKSCPEKMPLPGLDKCPIGVGGCRYHPVKCPGADEEIFTTHCYCDPDGIFQCMQGSFRCEGNPMDDVLEPPTIVDPLPIHTEEEIAETCPEKMPLPGLAKCSIGVGGCRYHPVKCPGADEETFTTHCYCDPDGIFQCMQASFGCEEHPTDDVLEPPTLVDPLPIHTEEEIAETCPEKMPLPGLAKCSIGVGGCRYHPIKCPGADEETFTTHCHCDPDGIFQCMQASFGCEEYPIEAVAIPAPSSSDLSCPEAKPMVGDACPPDAVNLFCEYQHQFYNIIRTEVCFCGGEGNTFSCETLHEDDVQATPEEDPIPVPADIPVDADVDDDDEYIADSSNPVSCPSSKPEEGDSCPMNNEELVQCKYYHRFFNVLKADTYFCLNGAFAYHNEATVEDAVEEEIIKTCPEDVPRPGLDKCSVEMPACLYNPFKCPGEDKETFITTCFCDADGTIQCLEALVECAGTILEPLPSLEQMENDPTSSASAFAGFAATLFVGALSLFI